MSGVLDELVDSVRVVNLRFKKPLPPVTFGHTTTTLATIPEGTKAPEEYDLTQGEERTEWFALDADDGMSVASVGAAPSEASSDGVTQGTERSLATAGTMQRWWLGGWLRSWWPAVVLC